MRSSPAFPLTLQVHGPDSGTGARVAEAGSSRTEDALPALGADHLAPTLPANATLSIRTHAQSLSALFPYLLNENNADLIVCCHYLLRSCPKTALAQDLPFPRKKRKYGCGSVGKVFVFGA